MKKIYSIIIIASLFFQFSCSGDDDVADSGDVQIRIKNVSQFDYTNIIVNTSGGENHYGGLSSQQTSDYGAFEFAYRYAFVELQIDAETFTIQPIDYVGETKLNPGAYTYEIGANDTTEQYGRLSIKLVAD